MLFTRLFRYKTSPLWKRPTRFENCRGGFQLARPATQISFADVVRVTDGSLALAPCANEIAPAKCQDCFEEDFCEIRRALLTARDVTANALRSYDVASAVARMRSAGTL